MGAHHNLLYHIVFSTKQRKPLLQNDPFRNAIWSYMAGIIKNQDSIAIQIGGYHDLAHMLVKIPPKLSVSKFVGTVKANTSKHINISHKFQAPFRWQESYAAFTVSQSQTEKVVNYIRNQEVHHQRTGFKEEFVGLLQKHNMEVDATYIWD